MWNGKQRKYYPDFIIGDQVFEVKGCVTEQSQAKSDQYPHINVLGKDEMKEILDKVIAVHGADFIKLYGR